MSVDRPKRADLSVNPGTWIDLDKPNRATVPGYSNTNGGAMDKPMIEPGAQEKVVTLRPLWWNDDPAPTVTLRPRRFATDEWEVFTADGDWVGTVGRYHGSLDRKAGRLRIAGKRRILWSYSNPGSRYTMWEQVSRADCIRSLLQSHARLGL